MQERECSLDEKNRVWSEMRMKNRINRGLGIALFVVGIAFCIAAVLGHEAAYSAFACCLFAAIPILSGSNHEKKG